MKLLQLLIITGIFICESSFLNAQTNSIPASPSEEKVTQFLAEVYLECPQYVESHHISEGIAFLDRVVYHEVPANEYPNCLLLSSIPLKNKCNPSLTYDSSNFNAETFNPFKYLFKFYSTEVAYFRVDGTNYIIEIKPKN